jgi:hypothetical protein
VDLPSSTFEVCRGPYYPEIGRPVAIVVGRAEDGLPPDPLLRLEYFVLFTQDPDTLIARAFRTLGTVPEEAPGQADQDIDLSYLLRLGREDAEARVGEHLGAAYDDPVLTGSVEAPYLEQIRTSYLTDLYFRVVGLGQFRRIARETCCSELADYLDGLDANGAILDRRDISV